MLEPALAMVADPLPAALVLSSPDWHEGVVGIVASRVAERFNRPAILLSEGDDEAKGSGRSIAGFDLLARRRGTRGAPARLRRAPRGLRAAAAARRHPGSSARRSSREAAAVAHADDLLVRAHVDAIVGGDELTLGLADELELLAPHGFGNRKVDAAAARRADRRAAAHPRQASTRSTSVRCDGASCSAIHFNFDGLDEAQRARGATTWPLALGKNDYNGAVSAQVQVAGLHRLEDGAAGSVRHLLRRSAATRRLSGEALWAAAAGRASGRAGATASRVPAATATRRRHRPRTPRRAGGRLAGPPRPPGHLAAHRAGSPPASACSCWSPTWRAAGRCSAATCCAPQLGLRGRCTCRPPAPAAWRTQRPAPDVVMAGADLALARPRLLARSFEHVAFVDPPFTRRLLGGHRRRRAARLAACALGPPLKSTSPRRSPRPSWTLQPPLRRVWRALQRGRAGLTRDSSRNSLGRSRSCAPVAARRRRARALREAGLLHRRRTAATSSSARRVRSTSPRQTLQTMAHTGFRHQTFCGPA